LKNRNTILAIRSIVALLIGVFSFYLARNITDSFDILSTQAWSGWLNILLYPYYIFCLISIMIFLFFLAWNIANYIFLKIGLIEIEESLVDRFQFFKYITDNRNILGVVVNTIYKSVLTIIFTLVVFFSLMFIISHTMSSRYDKNYEKSFYSLSFTTDYNDSRIIFYNHELEEASSAFISADSDYDIFKAFTKREMSLECIGDALHEHNELTSYKLLDGFKRNARNKYAYNRSLIKKNRNNERSFDKNIDYYRTSIINPASKFLKRTMPNRCDKKVSVEKMYNNFIPEYINITESKLASYRKSKMDHLNRWLNIVRRRYEIDINTTSIKR